MRSHSHWRSYLLGAQPGMIIPVDLDFFFDGDLNQPPTNHQPPARAWGGHVQQWHGADAHGQCGLPQGPARTDPDGNRCAIHTGGCCSDPESFGIFWGWGMEPKTWTWWLGWKLYYLGLSWIEKGDTSTTVKRSHGLSWRSLGSQTAGKCWTCKFST